MFYFIKTFFYFAETVNASAFYFHINYFDK